jgi:hypothetical protein
VSINLGPSDQISAKKNPIEHSTNFAPKRTNSTQDKEPPQTTGAQQKNYTPSIQQKKPIAISPPQKGSTSARSNRVHFETMLPTIFENPINFLQKRTREQSHKSQSAEDPSIGSLVNLLETILGEKLPTRQSFVTEVPVPTNMIYSETMFQTSAKLPPN